jgi:hypothetical protein
VAGDGFDAEIFETALHACELDLEYLPERSSESSRIHSISIESADA